MESAVHCPPTCSTTTIRPGCPATISPGSTARRPVPERTIGAGVQLSPEHYPREAFAWGGLTSGDSSRALWFLLLPFAFMNMAGWMLPTMSHRAWVVVRGLARMLAALGTVTLVMMSTQLATDLVGYQCGWLNPSCRTRWWLSFLEGGFWSTYPSRIIVLAAAVPLLVLAGVWAAGLISFRNFEEYVRRRHPDTDPQADEADRQAEATARRRWSGPRQTTTSGWSTPGSGGGRRRCTG